MSDQDIFNDNNPKDVDQTDDGDNTPDVVDIFADKLMSITKDDGSPKYDSVEKALDALKASQDHIRALETDNRQYKDKIEELTAASEKIAELEEVIRRMSDNGQNDDAGKPQGGNPPDTGGLSEQDAAELVRKILNEEKQVTTAVENIKTVQQKLVAKFGDEATTNAAIKEKAAELGTTPARLKEMAAESPNMVLSLFGEKSSSPSATTSSVNVGLTKPAPEPLKAPEKSVLSGSGATDKNRAELMAKIKEEVYRKYGVTS